MFKILLFIAGCLLIVLVNGLVWKLYSQMEDHPGFGLLISLAVGIWTLFHHPLLLLIPIGIELSVFLIGKIYKSRRDKLRDV